LDIKQIGANTINDPLNEVDLDATILEQIVCDKKRSPLRMIFQINM